MSHWQIRKRKDIRLAECSSKWKIDYVFVVLSPETSRNERGYWCATCVCVKWNHIRFFVSWWVPLRLLIVNCSMSTVSTPCRPFFFSPPHTRHHRLHFRIHEWPRVHCFSVSSMRRNCNFPFNWVLCWRRCDGNEEKFIREMENDFGWIIMHPWSNYNAKYIVSFDCFIRVLFKIVLRVPCMDWMECKWVTSARARKREEEIAFHGNVACIQMQISPSPSQPPSLRCARFTYSPFCCSESWKCSRHVRTAVCQHQLRCTLHTKFTWILQYSLRFRQVQLTVTRVTTTRFSYLLCLSTILVICRALHYYIVVPRAIKSL